MAWWLIDKSVKDVSIEHWLAFMKWYGKYTANILNEIYNRRIS